jgi:hypothetical protein
MSILCEKEGKFKSALQFKLHTLSKVLFEEDRSCLGYDAMSFGDYLVMFQRGLLTPP